MGYDVGDKIYYHPDKENNLNIGYSGCKGEIIDKHIGFLCYVYDILYTSEEGYVRTEDRVLFRNLSLRLESFDYSKSGRGQDSKIESVIYYKLYDGGMYKVRKIDLLKGKVYIVNGKVKINTVSLESLKNNLFKYKVSDGNISIGDKVIYTHNMYIKKSYIVEVIHIEDNNYVIDSEGIISYIRVNKNTVQKIIKEEEIDMMEQPKVSVSREGEYNKVRISDLSAGDLFVVEDQLCRLMLKDTFDDHYEYKIIKCWNSVEIDHTCTVEIPKEVNIEYNL